MTPLLFYLECGGTTPLLFYLPPQAGQSCNLPPSHETPRAHSLKTTSPNTSDIRPHQ